jgi:hypothetical protein
MAPLSLNGKWSTGKHPVIKGQVHLGKRPCKVYLKRTTKPIKITSV